MSADSDFSRWRTALCSIAAVAFAACTLLGVACSSAPVASPGVDGGTDAPLHEAGPPPDAAASQCPLGDGGVAPQGRRLVSSPTASILGVTSDGYAIYEDRQFSDIYAVSLLGGTPEQIGPSWGAGSSGVSIFGSVVLYWTGVQDFDTYPFIGQLVVWTAKGRSKVLAPASLLGQVAVSSDGKYVAYSDNATGDYPGPDAGTNVGVGAGDIFVSAPDGSGKTSIASHVAWSAECQPNLVFVGSSLVTASCAAANLPQPAATLRAYGAPAFSLATTLNSQPAYTGIGHDTTRISYYTTGEVLTIQNVAGGPVPIMANAYSSSISNDGTFVMILDYNGTIYRSPTTSSSISLVSPGYISINAISPDDKWLIVSKSQDPKSGLYDTFLLPTAASSVATPLVATTTGAFLNDWFTVDNSRVIFGANNKPAPYGFFGDFAAVTLAAPSTPALTVTSTAWSAYATTGAKTVFNDGYDLVFPALPTADIQVIDLANPSTRTKLVSHADANFYVSSDRTKAVYSWTYCADDRAGLYVVDLP